MKELYSEPYRQSVRAQLKRRLIPLCVLSCALLGVAIWAFIGRQQVIAVAAVLLMGGLLIFSLDVFCKPLWQYDRFLSDALTSRSHTDVLVYDHPESEISVVDGVAYRSLVFLGEPDKHGTREQMYYWDNELPLPDLVSGQRVNIRYTGKMITAWEPA